MKFKWKTKKRLFILSLDGVPYSFLQEGISAGRFSNIDRLGEMVEIKSVFPPVSSVAWATFATGVNPANHGIFGFIDRDPATMTQRIPTSRDLVSPTIWQMLNDAGRRTIAMNVPLTYPPREVNGVMISGFLCTKLEQGVQPPSLLPRLRQLDYRIDPDPAMAAEDSAGYLDEILTTLRARRRALFALLKEPWDLFMCHVMMTDRINHFFWADGQQEDSAFYERFWQFYDEIDALVGEVNAALASNTEFLVLSDHGFCRLCQEVDLNAYLAEGGFLRLTGNGGEGRSGVDPSSRAYSLLPGRIYVNLAGREKSGAVSETQYDRLREELATFFEELRDPQGNPVVSKTVYREEAYTGKLIKQSPDLLLLPRDGYDLKARFSPGPVFAPAERRSGMHTYDDAFVLLRARRLRVGGSILDVTPVLFELLGLPVPSHLEGESLLSDGVS